MNKNKNKNFIYSDNWWIENEKAWFIGAERNMLFEVDLQNNNVKFVDIIPECTMGFREFTKCVKWNNDIYCLPGYGKKIWIYSLDTKKWNELIYQADSKRPLEIWNCVVFNNKLYCIVEGEGKILEIDLDTQKTKQYYVNREERIVRSAIFRNIIYIHSSEGNILYTFDMETKEVNSFKLSIYSDTIYAIAVENNNIWMGAYAPVIYKWDGKRVVSITLKKELDVLNKKSPYIAHLVCCGKYLWCFSTYVKDIYYIDLCTNEVSVLEIDSEEEKIEDVQNRIPIIKYQLLYVRKKRYIGVFSCKNNCLYEIDSENLEYKIISFKMDEETRLWEFLDVLTEKEEFIFCEWMKHIYSKNKVK